jgi:hypothetical protein
MPYPTQFIRLTWGGGFQAEEEQWSNGLNFASPSGFVNSEFQALGDVLPLIGTIIQAWHTNPDAGISNRCTLEWVKIALIGTNTSYAEEAIEYQYIAPVAGGSTGAIETQRSLAVSFKTAVRRGPASNGRFYIPAYRLGVGSDGRVTTSDQTDLLAAALVFIADLNDEISNVLPTTSLHVMSAQGSGHQEPVTSIRVGNVIDSQRRRKNKMIETYVSGPL